MMDCRDSRLLIIIIIFAVERIKVFALSVTLKLPSVQIILPVNVMNLKYPTVGFFS